MRTANTLEELAENPEAYGFCTFDQFRRNRDKWIGREDDEFQAIDRGNTNLKCKQKYFFEGWECSSLEQVERFARDEGCRLTDLWVDPQVTPDHLAGFYIRINFWNKATITKRRKWA